MGGDPSGLSRDDPRRLVASDVNVSVDEFVGAVPGEDKPVDEAEPVDEPVRDGDIEDMPPFCLFFWRRVEVKAEQGESINYA